MNVTTYAQLKRAFIVLLVVWLACMVIQPVSATVVGIRWNVSNSSPQAISYIDINGNPAAKPDFNMTLPWSGIRSINTSLTQYQWMSTIPKFWYNTSNQTIGGYWYRDIWVSDRNETGFRVHPEFIQDGVEIPSTLIGSFEGSIWNSTTGYNTGDFSGVVISADQLSSIPGVKPASGKNNSITRDNFITLANNRNATAPGGRGWGIQDFDQVSALQTLYVIEYCDLNSQHAIGPGVTQITDDGLTNMAVNTGFTRGYGVGGVDLGNASGQVTISHYKTSQTTYPNSYRSVENFYGNMWKWVANFDIIDHVAYVNGVNTGITLPATNGWGKTPAVSAIMDYGWLPSTVGGSATIYFSDYYYQDTGTRIALLGGDWSAGANAGLFDWGLGNAPTASNSRIGARLSYTPNSTALLDQNLTFIPANASYTQNATFGYAPLPVQFTDTSAGSPPLTYRWIIANSTSTGGNGTQYVASTTQSPIITLGIGNWTVIEEVTSPYDISNSTASWVNVTDYPPLAQFTPYNPFTSWLPTTIQWNMQNTTNQPVTCLWSFGDGTTSTVCNATHTYTRTGTFPVQFTATNSGGSSTNTTTVQVIL